MPFGAKTVLIMEDEGLQIYVPRGSGVSHVGFIEWGATDFLEQVRVRLVRQGRKKPVVLFNDMVEQHYRKESIPKVSIADRANVLKNKLNVTFPNYRARAALKLPEARADGGQNYLFSAVPVNEIFHRTLQAIRVAGVDIKGFYLLPIEGVQMINDVSKKLVRSKSGGVNWTIFAGQQGGGGMRQIVTRNNALALTRITPIVDTDVEPGLWAKEVTGELSSTLSYLRRFGYHDNDTLTIIVLGNEAVADPLQGMLQTSADLHVLSVHEAAGLIKKKIPEDIAERYSDPLYAAYFAGVKRFTMPLQVPAVKEYMQPRQLGRAIMGGVFLLLLWLCYSALTLSGANSEASAELTMLESDIASKEQEVLRLNEEAKAIGFDLLMVDAAVNSYLERRGQGHNLLTPMQQIGRALGPDLYLSDLRFSVAKELPAQAQAPYQYQANREGAAEDQERSEITLELDFAPDVDPAVAVQQVEQFSDRLRSQVIGYNVVILKQVADLSYSGNVVGGEEATERNNSYNAILVLTELGNES